MAINSTKSRENKSSSKMLPPVGCLAFQSPRINRVSGGSKGLRLPANRELAQTVACMEITPEALDATPMG